MRVVRSLAAISKRSTPEPRSWQPSCSRLGSTRPTPHIYAAAEIEAMIAAARKLVPPPRLVNDTKRGYAAGRDSESRRWHAVGMTKNSERGDGSYVIEQFMWGYQGHFRIGVYSRIKSALELIHAYLEPRVILVGFAVDPAKSPHAVCIEPEEGPLQGNHLSEVTNRAQEIYEQDPENAVWSSNADHDAARRANRLCRARAAALVEAIETSGTMPGQRLVVSTGGRIDGFEVHTCVAVNRERFDALPVLPHSYTYGVVTPSSFALHLIELILVEADISLGLANPSMGAIRRSGEDLIREAAKHFCSGCLYRTKNFDMSDPFSALNAATSQTYERAGAAGRLLLVSPTHERLEIAAKLVVPIDMTSTRAVRKLLETSDGTLALLVHSGGVYGLGRFSGHVETSDAFEIVVTGHATWELRSGGDTYLRAGFGTATLPRPTFSPSWASDIIKRTLNPDPESVERLVRLIDAATRGGHGTTLVISAHATEEAQRLSGQATLVEPAVLSEELLDHFARIDGALLVDPDAVCHAVGVILDGHAEGQGDPARGSRYNSAVRYEASATPSTVVVVVVSEDGNVNLIPPLRRQIQRRQVTDSITHLLRGHEEDNRSEVADALRAIRELSFYLTAEQCEVVNRIGHEDEARSMGSQEITLIYNDLTPSSELTDAYFCE
jgi:hypothetical protein